MFDRLDKDSNGELSVEELLGLLEEAEINDKAKQEAQQLIDTMDLDKDGKLSRKEWTEAFGKIFEMIKSKEGAGESGTAAGDAADKKDIVQEIIGDAKDKKEAEKNAGDVFDRLDKDKNGNLSVKELMGLLEESEINDKAKQEAQALIDTMDLDKDGKLSRKEWTEAFGKIFEMVKSKEGAGKSGSPEKGAPKEESKEDLVSKIIGEAKDKK